MMGSRASLQIVRARMRGVRVDPLQARIAVQRMAASADLGRMLGPAAILIVRRARLDLASDRPGGRRPTLDAVLRPLVDRATRPIRSFVPADAEAVLFADEVELLVCLARASLAGSLTGEWWWKGLLAGGSDVHALVRSWLAHAQAIAPALDALDRTGEAAAFLRHVGPRAASAVGQAIARALGLDHVAGVSPDTTVVPAGSDAQPQRGAAPKASAAAPWQTLGLDAAALALPPSLQYAAGLAVSVCRAPAEARTSRFARAVQAWLAQEALDDAGDAAPHEAEAKSVGTAVMASAVPLAPSDQPASAGAWSRKEDPLEESAAASRAAMPPGRSLESEAAAAAPELWRADATGEVPVRSGAASSRLAAHVDRSEPERREWTVPDVSVVDTRFGGLLFLLNVALALELWGDFTAPHDQRTPLSPWAWLAAIGERLCGASLRADPLWDMLERLIDDGESVPDPDGEDDWRIPRDWLRPFGAKRPLRAFSGGGRLRLEHPEGFPLAGSHLFP